MDELYGDHPIIELRSVAGSVGPRPPSSHPEYLRSVCWQTLMAETRRLSFSLTYSEFLSCGWWR